MECPKCGFKWEHSLDYKILNMLKEYGPMTLHMLAVELGKDKTYVWQRLQVLVEKGDLEKRAKGFYTWFEPKTKGG